MLFHRRKVSGFSLLEVIIAVGIFAVAVSAMLGLLPSLTRQSANSTDILNALRLPDALRVELQRMAVCRWIRCFGRPDKTPGYAAA